MVTFDASYERCKADSWCSHEEALHVGKNDSHDKCAITLIKVELLKSGRCTCVLRGSHHESFDGYHRSSYSNKLTWLDNTQTISSETIQDSP